VGNFSDRHRGISKIAGKWAGHSVDVLLRVYAKCISGQQEDAKRRIEEATRPSGGAAR
jgi:hypothetical protein